MEFTQFISYLDYGVLGLSAIILILSFVLLSREQKREVFRPEVAGAIRKYMMLALAFAGVGLVSTIVDGVMVQPSKEEKKLQEERLELLSDMLAMDIEKRIGEASTNAIVDSSGKEGETKEIVEVDTGADIEDAIVIVDTPKEEVPNVVEENAVDSTAGDTIADIIPVRGGELPSEIVVKEMRRVVEEDAYHVKSDRGLFDTAVDKASAANNAIQKNRDKISDVYDEVIKTKE